MGLIRYLPTESATWTLANIPDESAPVAAAKPEPRKVDYDALRKLGGEVITIPRKAG